MDEQEILDQAKRLRAEADKKAGLAIVGEAMELIRHYVGENNSSYQHLKTLTPTMHHQPLKTNAIFILDGFISIVQNGLLAGVSIERQAQIDVVSDFLEQAQKLLNTKGVHPAAPCVIIGAALEEFLRNWVEEKNLTITAKNPSIDAYAKALKEADLITTQDMKDITSWAGRRNHAAHGEWTDVGDKTAVSNMLEGVNLFMRKYGPNA